MRRNKNSLDIQRSAFNAIGINIDWEDDLYKTLNAPLRFFFLLATALLFSLSLITGIFTSGRDINSMTADICIMAQCYISIAKLLPYLMNGKRLAKLTANLQKSLAEAKGKELAAGLAEDQREQFIVKIHRFLCMSTTVFYYITPLGYCLVKYITTGQLLLMLPSQGYYPYDINKPLLYILTYVCDVLGVYFLAFSTVAVDCHFCWYVFKVSAHFHILNVMLEELAESMNEEHIPTLAEFQYKIKKFHNYHMRTLNFVKEFDAVICPIILVVVSLNCFLICMPIYQLSTASASNDLSHLLLVAMVFMAVLFQSIIYCLGGEKIKNENENLCNAIYLAIPWHLMTSSMQRLLLLPLIRSQRDCNITGYIFIANRTSLVWIFKTAGSISALVSAMEQKRTLQE